MLITFNKRGGTTDNRKSSGGQAAQDYLLGRHNDRKHARLLRGDPEITTEIINGLNFAKIYTSGVLAFDYGEGDDLSEQDKQEIIDSFEIALFPNLEADQYTGYWVEHTDKFLCDEQEQPIFDAAGKRQRRLELNFVFANVELTTGKALPVYYHRNDVHLMNAWRDVTNAVYDLADPNAISRKRALTTVKDLPKDIAEMREMIHDFLISNIESGDIQNRADIVNALKSIDLKIARETDTSISIKNPDGSRNIRLKGVIYEKGFEREKLSCAYTGSGAPERTIDLTEARERYDDCIAKRSKNLGRRFATTAENREQRPEFSGKKRDIFAQFRNQNAEKSRLHSQRSSMSDVSDDTNHIKRPQLVDDTSEISIRNDLHSHTILDSDVYQKEIETELAFTAPIPKPSKNKPKAQEELEEETRRERFSDEEIKKLVAKANQRQADAVEEDPIAKSFHYPTPIPTPVPKVDTKPEPIDAPEPEVYRSFRP